MSHLVSENWKTEVADVVDYQLYKTRMNIFKEVCGWDKRMEYNWS